MRFSVINREIFRIALPSIVTNITVPLLGIVDLAIVGHMAGSPGSGGSAAAIGAISVGTLIFNMVYWIFNFLRMGSSGLAAQAYGSADQCRQMQVLLQAVTVGVACGLLLVMLQRPVEWAAYQIIAPSSEVWDLAVAYFRIRIWAAPAVLMLFAVNGWFVGMQNSLYPMTIAIGQNVINIAVSAWLVFVEHWGIEGVAWGTVISQYAGLCVAAMLWYVRYRQLRLLPRLWYDVWHDTTSLRRFFTVNRDIFFRMLFLIAVTMAFTSFSARQGDLLLAVNTLLMQFFTLFSYFTDGFALAGEALVGKYVGARNSASLRSCTWHLLAWGGIVAILFTLLYGLGGEVLLSFLTDDAAVVVAAGPYLPWVIAIPAVGFAAFLWDGIYIGATATRLMLCTLIVAATCFFGLYFGFAALEQGMQTEWLSPNHRLWLSFLVYLGARSLVQSLWARRIGIG